MGQKLKHPPAELGPRQVDLVVGIDGCKLVLDDGSWVLFRQAAEEPLVWITAESRTLDELPELMAAARNFLLS